MVFVEITDKPIHLDGVLRHLELSPRVSEGCPEEPEVGAVVTFSGVVRATEGPRTISHLDYEHYEGMARAEAEKLAVRACEHWKLGRVAIVHRVGAVPVGDASVVVAVGAGHRAEAFEAARFLIDELKAMVPIWKHAPEES